MCGSIGDTVREPLVSGRSARMSGSKMGNYLPYCLVRRVKVLIDEMTRVMVSFCFSVKTPFGSLIQHI